jgi:hypothetical protein
VKAVTPSVGGKWHASTRTRATATVRDTRDTP